MCRFGTLRPILPMTSQAPCRNPRHTARPACHHETRGFSNCSGTLPSVRGQGRPILCRESLKAASQNEATLTATPSPTDAAPAPAASPSPQTPAATGQPAAATVLASLGQAAFVWDLASDAITWSDHAGTVFRDIPPAALASGAELAKLIEPSRSIRADALSNSQPADGSGAESYRIEYGVRSSTSSAVL